jgi:hypothetical protein
VRWASSASRKAASTRLLSRARVASSMWLGSTPSSGTVFTLSVPVRSVPGTEAEAHFGFLAHFITLDGPASSALTRERTGWQPAQPGLIPDLDKGHYFD